MEVALVKGTQRWARTWGHLVRGLGSRVPEIWSLARRKTGVRMVVRWSELRMMVVTGVAARAKGRERDEKENG